MVLVGLLHFNKFDPPTRLFLVVVVSGGCRGFWWLCELWCGSVLLWVYIAYALGPAPVHLGVVCLLQSLLAIWACLSYDYIVCGFVKYWLARLTS